MPSATLSHRRLLCGALSFVVCITSLGASPALARRRQSPAPARKGVAPKSAADKKPATKLVVPAPWRAALERIAAEDMRGHLVFLSSDLLEGRKTPSRGLDIAAEYIAAQFRRAGLEPAGDDGYFQTAAWTLSGREAGGIQMRFSGLGVDGLNVEAERLSFGFSAAGMRLWSLDEGIALNDVQLLKAALDALTHEQAGDKVVVTEFPSLPRGDRSRAMQLLRQENDFLARLHALGVPLVISLDRAGARGRAGGQTRLVDPDSAAESPSALCLWE